MVQVLRHLPLCRRDVTGWSLSRDNVNHMDSFESSLPALLERLPDQDVASPCDELEQPEFANLLLVVSVAAIAAAALLSLA